MTVNKELSVVADSTHSPSSPFPNVTTRTVKRTYGRTKMSDDPDTSLPFSSASRDSTYRTGPPDLDEQVAPSSDLSHSFSDNELADDENEGSPQDALADDFFGLRRQMRDYDATHGFGVDMSAMSDIPHRSHSEQPPATETLSFQRVQSPHVPTSPAVAPSNTLSCEVLEESLSTLTPLPLSPRAIPQSPSPLASHVGHARRRLKRRVMHGSDSESEPAGNKCTSATRSPAFPHPISTPKSRSSPTPPTSDDEMPAYPMQRHDSKGKGKANPAGSRSTVVPLQFSEGPNGSSVVSTKSLHKEKRNKKFRIKPPTKKELKETRRDGARLAADQPVSIPRNGGETQKYTLQHFFTGLAGRPIAKEPSSDPIGEFSSPPKDDLPSINQQSVPTSTSMFPGCETSAFHSMTGESLRPTILKAMASLGDLDSDSDALPEVGELVSEEQKKQDQAHARYALLEKKKLLLAQQAEKRVVSDDDDLEIMPPKEMSAVVKKEEAGRMSGKKRISEGRKRQLNLGGIGLERQRVKGTSKDDVAPFAISSVGRLKGNNASLTQGELNKSLVRRVMSVNEESTKKKEDEWVRRGGKVIDGTQLSSANDASTTYAEKGLQAAEERGVAMEVDGDDEDEDEGSDEDWMPAMRGSASPSPQPDDGEGGKEDDDDEQAVEEEQEADITMVNPENEGDDFDEERILKVRPRRRAQAIVDSGDEGNEDPFSILKPKQPTFGSPQDDNNENAMLPISIPSTNYRGSLSSTDERTEDENDKENNTSLMFDHSENKENKAVVRHGDASGKHPLGTRTSSLFGLELGIARRLSMSPVLHSQGIDADDEDDESEEGRSPLKDLLDDDPFQVTSSKLSTSFAVRLQQASPAATLPPDANLAPFTVRDDSYPHSPAEPSRIGLELLQPGFSDLFESGTEKQKVTPFKRPAGLGLSESFSDEEPAFDKLRKPGPPALGLTQDVVLQPAFQIGDSLLRKADQIFEKEQGYLLEAASKKLQKEPTLYVNDHGFLTQTRPDAASPRVYIPPSPSQTLTLLNPLHLQSSERPPLRTLTLDKAIDFDSPDLAPLRRLRRGVPAPSRSPVADAGHRFSPSLSPDPQKRPPNVFDVMISAAKATNEKVKRRLEKSEFVEAEAQESDDDEMFGFGGRKKDDGEEEDGEDLDKTLETLVDDQEMDEETVNAQLVHKKYQEHADQDDREIEKLHQAAIQGDLRKKKRNHGVGLDDSDDNSDDEEKNRRIRRGMNKKPKIDRDNIRDLANFDETKAFFQVYEHSLVNNQNFEFLEKTRDVVMSNEGQEEDEGVREYVTSAEIRRRVREQADEGEDEESVDPHDVSWVDLGDASDGEGSIRVKSIRRQTRSWQNGIDNAVPSFENPKPVTMPGTTIARMQHWARVEGRSRNAGTTGRSVGGAAVTGHGRGKVKTGGGSLRSGPTASVASTDSGRTSEQRRPVKATRSVLAGVAAERSARFG